jgi:hypothetical protein
MQKPTGRFSNMTKISTSIKPISNPYERTCRMGSWKRKPDNSIVWEEIKKVEKFNLDLKTWLAEPEIITEYTPESMGLSRSAVIDIIFIKSYPSRENFDETENVIFHTQYQYQIQSDQTENIMLKKSEGKLFCVSIDPEFGMCAAVGFESNGNYTIKKGKPVRIDQAKGKEIAKTTKYIFAKQLGEDFCLCV